MSPRDLSWLTVKKGRIPTYRGRGDGGIKTIRTNVRVGRQTSELGSARSLGGAGCQCPARTQTSELIQVILEQTRAAHWHPIHSLSLTHICTLSSIYSICLISHQRLQLDLLMFCSRLWNTQRLLCPHRSPLCISITRTPQQLL